ncbi:MAG: hypothetical protein EVB11_09015 [Winogradskyella sp.]|nr:MAG: hypothetical protein EVB11_09015 [Winogradskyella sp.]
MFIYNYGSAPIKYDSKRPKNITCHNCKEKGQTFVNRYLKYFYILYIPIFTYKYWTKYECVRCKFSANEKDLTKELQEAYRPYKKKKILPIWTFSGLLALIIIPLAYNIFTSNGNQRMLNQVDFLEINQKFDFKTESDNYSIFKVVNINTNKLGIIYNKLEVKSKDNLVEIDSKNNYSDDTIASSIAELKNWIEEDKIIYIYK